MSEKQKIRLGSRGSELAMWQANWTRDRLLEHHPEVDVEIVEVKTTGDVDVTTPLANIGEVGLFTHTLEQKLLKDEIDVAVHSLKDVPAELAAGCALVCFSPREDPRDAWFHKDGLKLDDVPQGAKIATGSLRRRSQLLARRPDLNMVELRGNVNTRWKKFEEGRFDGMILAAAGVKRLGWEDRITELVDPDVLLPAVGQGILGLEVVEGSFATRLLRSFNNENAELCAVVERTVLETVAGGCVVPLAGYCELHGETFWLRTRLGKPDGSQLLEAQGKGPVDQGASLGRDIARQLLAEGGADIVTQAKENARKD